eukprot:CAMPEP_0115223332 /NCGR_PEP_ID=MMETSP0270-20121206/28992_1 /TAXON_ID=71861 /ORGANISM="Scrippsiella trochoidea, Strain CCMP3099" /LENGTH=72 /DNA_ID=CAMNT_0002637583 /DNA_START=261 /DNA_END=477 /DNA_ORIENTATION=+
MKYTELLLLAKLGSNPVVTTDSLRRSRSGGLPTPRRSWVCHSPGTSRATLDATAAHASWHESPAAAAAAAAA